MENPVARVREIKKKGGPSSYIGRVSISENTVVVYNKSKTFAKKKLATEWAVTHEVEVRKTRPWVKAKRSGLLVSKAFVDYIAEIEDTPNGVGPTKKQSTLHMAKNDVLKDIPIEKLGRTDLMAYIKARAKVVSPSTVGADLSYIKVVMDYARIVWGLDTNTEFIKDVKYLGERLGIVSSSNSVERRPTLEELDKCLAYFTKEGRPYLIRTKLPPDMIPMKKIIPFQIFSTRRISETCRIEWEDLDLEKKRVLVRDAKHPRKKKGNHRWASLCDRSIAIILSMPKVEGEPRIFPYKSHSVGSIWSRARNWAHINDLRLHDMRHEGISHHFELQKSIQDVAKISLHEKWDTLKSYTHVTELGYIDKYENWSWFNKIVDS
jgi:integrase